MPDVCCLITTSPRSGSWLLSAALQDTGLVGTPEEYYRPDMTTIWSDQWGLPRRASYARYIRESLDYGTTANGVFSAKLHWYQMAWLLTKLRAMTTKSVTELDDRLLIEKRFPQPHFVHLYRRDAARQALSYFRAGRTGVWFVLGEQNETPSRGRERDAQVLPSDAREPSQAEWQHVRWLETLVESHNGLWRAFFATHEIQPHAVAYEDFVADLPGTVGGVLEFLGAGSRADVATLQPRLVRQADELTEQWLARYIEIRDSIEPRQLPRSVLRPPARQ